MIIVAKSKKLEIYDAPVIHVSKRPKEVYPGLSFDIFPAYQKLADIEKRMYEKIKELKPTKIFSEGLYAGKQMDKNYLFDDSNSWDFEKKLHENGTIIEGMENEYLLRFHHVLFDRCKPRDCDSPVKARVKYLFYSALRNIIDGARSYGMAKNVIKCLDSNDVAIMIHGTAHNLRRTIRLLDRNIRILPLDEILEKEAKETLRKLKKESDEYILEQ